MGSQLFCRFRASLGDKGAMATLIIRQSHLTALAVIDGTSNETVQMKHSHCPFNTLQRKEYSLQKIASFVDNKPDNVQVGQCFDAIEELSEVFRPTWINTYFHRRPDLLIPAQPSTLQIISRLPKLKTHTGPHYIFLIITILLLHSYCIHSLHSYHS